MSFQSERVKTVRRRDYLFVDPSWGALCVACNAWLTKYDHTEQDAREVAIIALPRHRCRA